MLKMDQVHVVRHKVLIEKLSQRQVATDLGLSRNTVSKYLSVPEPLRQVVNPRSATVGLKAAARIEELLVEWRDRVVRDGVRTYRDDSGREVVMSLSGTCIGACHTDKAKFCDRCHDYAAVAPACWDCHIVPEAAPAGGGGR